MLGMFEIFPHFCYTKMFNVKTIYHGNFKN